MKSILLNYLLIFFPISLMAEEAYITDQLKAGLHEEKSVDSPIVKIVNTGTRLEIVKREQKLTFVRDANGITGWINNKYLMAKAPDNASLETLQVRADNLEKRVAEFREKNIALESELEKQGKVLPAETREFTTLKSAHSKLKQDFNSQKLTTGELQIELTELRKRVGKDSGSDDLYRQVESLEEDNKKLEIQLANTLEKYGAAGAKGLDMTGSSNDIGSKFTPGFRNMLIYLLITLVLGLFAGAYILDMVNRRRHGGFRI